MREWSRGDKIAFWSLLVGVVSCIVAIESIPESTSGAGEVVGVDDTAPPIEQFRPLVDLEAARIEEERERGVARLREEQSRAAREEILRLHAQRVETRVGRMAALARELDASGARSYYSFALQNQCSLPLYAAMYYRDLDDRWVVRGWWKIPPGETVRPNVMSKNAIVYFFANTDYNSVVWNGDGKPGALVKPAPESEFYLLDDENNPYESTRSESYFRWDLPAPAAWGEYTHSFTCTSYDSSR